MTSVNDKYAVSVENLEKRFGDFIAVNNISFTVGKGEIFGFLGPNGAGKSTTIRMLCGLLVPDGGSGYVAGLDIRTQSETIKSNIGYMSQKFSLYEDLTVEENIDFYGGIYKIDPVRKEERKQWAISMAGLSDHRKNLTVNLSGGWKQRLALGCAILHEPPVIFLDEPTSGVDPISRRMFWNLIYELADKGVTIFVTTHYMDEAEYCDRIALIYRGELIALGTPHELKTKRMPGNLLEISVSKPNEALAFIDNFVGVQEASLFGNNIHAITENAVLPEQIKQSLYAEGFVDAKVEKILPSLEDIFVTLIEEKDRAVKQAGEMKS